MTTRFIEADVLPGVNPLFAEVDDAVVPT